jgi:hypothetical protein
MKQQEEALNGSFKNRAFHVKFITKSQENNNC